WPDVSNTGHDAAFQGLMILDIPDRKTPNTSESDMDAKTDDKGAGKCPFTGGGSRGHANRDWWPEALSIETLHRNSNLSDPMDRGFNYTKEFKTLDLKALMKDLKSLMTDSQPWWPA